MTTINATYRNKRAILFGFMLSWMAYFAVQTAEADDRRTDDGDVVIVGARTYYDDVINAEEDFGDLAQEVMGDIDDPIL